MLTAQINNPPHGRKLLKSALLILGSVLTIYVVLHLVADTYDKEDLLEEIIGDRASRVYVHDSLDGVRCFVSNDITDHERLLLLSGLNSALRAHRTALVENQSAEFIYSQSLLQRIRLSFSGSTPLIRERVLSAVNDLADLEGLTGLERSLEACGRG